MKGLNIQEVQQISGAGFIQDIGTNIGAGVGNVVYSFSKDYLNVEVSFLGNVNIGVIMPNLGREVGGSIGGSIGAGVESALGSIPLVGGLFNLLFNK